MVSIKLQDRKFLRIFIIVIIFFFVLYILLETITDKKEIYDLNNIVLDMTKDELGIKVVEGQNYNLDQKRNTYKDLYYFYEPLSQDDINVELESIINYEIKVIDTIHQLTNIESINGYNYSLNEDSCFINFFKANQEFLYNELMKDQNYKTYLWDIEKELNPPTKWYFNKMGDEVSWVVKKDAHEYLTNQVNNENKNLLDDEMYVRIYKFETWIASKARSSCGLSTIPDITYD